MHTHRVRDVHRAADLALLETILEQLCEERGLTYEQPQASLLAARLLLQFEGGVREREALLAAVGGELR